MNNQDEKFYEVAAREVASKSFSPGLMAKAFSDTGGDKDKTVARYLRLRVAQLKRDFMIQMAQCDAHEKERQEAERRRRHEETDQIQHERNQEARTRLAQTVERINEEVSKLSSRLRPLQQEVFPHKKRRNKIKVLGMLCGVGAAGVPTSIVCPDAGAFATLVGVGLGYIASHVYFVLSSGERAIGRKLRTVRKMEEEIMALQERAEEAVRKVQR